HDDLRAWLKFRVQRACLLLPDVTVVSDCESIFATDLRTAAFAEGVYSIHPAAHGMERLQQLANYRFGCDEPERMIDRKISNDRFTSKQKVLPIAELLFELIEEENESIASLVQRWNG